MRPYVLFCLTTPKFYVSTLPDITVDGIIHSRITSELHTISLNGDALRAQTHKSSEYDISNCDRVHHFSVYSFYLSR